MVDYTQLSIKGKTEAELEALDLALAKADLKVAHTRNRLLLGWAAMMEKAYLALLEHRINFYVLPEFTAKSELVERAAKEEISLGESKLHEWMNRVMHGIQAAINRKGFKKV